MSAGRFAVVAGALGVVVGVALSHPLAAHVRSAFLDDGTSDAYQFAWNLWWVWESLGRLHTNPFFTRYLFYPEGVSLLFHTFSLSLGVLALPVQATLGPVVAQNALVLAAPALTLLFVGLLARDVTGDPWAALCAGLAAAVNPIAVWFLPLVYLNCIYLMAAVLLLWRRFQRRRRPAALGLLLVALAVLVFASQEYAMMVLALLAIDSLWRLGAPRALAPEPAWVGGTAAFWLLVAAGLGTASLVLRGGGPSTPPPLGHLLVFSGWVAALYTPPWIVRPPEPFFTILFLGTAPLLLLPAALALARGRATWWLLAVGVTAVMALGPELHLRYPDYPRAVRGQGSLPWGPPGPYWLAMHVVPFMRLLRAPYRWIAAAQVPLAVLTALAVAGLRARVPIPHRRAALTAALLGLVGAAAALDVRGLRAPLVSATVPTAYAAVRDDPEPSAVLDLPSGVLDDSFASFASRYMFYQTAHRKFLLEGTVARVPTGVRPIVYRKITDFAALPYVKYAVVHRRLLAEARPASRDQVGRLEALLATQATRIADEDGITVYRLHTFRPESVH